jgi:hypothetical protein
MGFSFLQARKKGILFSHIFKCAVVGVVIWAKIYLNIKGWLQVRPDPGPPRPCCQLNRHVKVCWEFRRFFIIVMFLFTHNPILYSCYTQLLKCVHNNSAKCFPTRNFLRIGAAISY